MLRLTLNDVRASRIPKHLGICPTDAVFTEYLNEAQERLISRGHFNGAFQRVNICISNGCITLPRQIVALSEVALCGEPIPIHNQWYEFLPGGDGVQFKTGCTNGSCSNGCPGRGFMDRGVHPTFSDIIGLNKRIRLYPTIASDVGKRVLVQGIDDNRDAIRTLDGSTYVDGFYLTLAEPFVESTFDVSGVTGVQKDVTDGNVLMYEVSSAGTQRLLGIYEPSETVAGYRRYFMSGYSDCGTGCAKKTITAIAKLQFIPVSAGTDYLYVTNIPALKEMCQSIRYLEMDSSDSKGLGRLHEMRAIKELNMEKRTMNGDDQIAVSMRVHGSAPLRNRRIGSLT